MDCTATVGLGEAGRRKRGTDLQLVGDLSGLVRMWASGRVIWLDDRVLGMWENGGLVV